LLSDLSRNQESDIIAKFLKQASFNCHNNVLILTQRRSPEIGCYPISSFPIALSIKPPPSAQPMTNILYFVESSVA
jgi:hypothetical protein